MFLLGWMHARGIGVPRNLSAAVELFQKGIDRSWKKDPTLRWRPPLPCSLSASSRPSRCCSVPEAVPRPFLRPSSSASINPPPPPSPLDPLVSWWWALCKVLSTLLPTNARPSFPLMSALLSRRALKEFSSCCCCCCCCYRLSSGGSRAWICLPRRARLPLEPEPPGPPRSPPPGRGPTPSGTRSFSGSSSAAYSLSSTSARHASRVASRCVGCPPPKPSPNPQPSLLRLLLEGLVPVR